jgi:GNAT superfamily N-acetyltransferase
VSVTGAMAQREAFTVREATPDDRSEIEALIAEMIPGCDVAARWRWLYETNPGGPALTWLAIAPSGEVAGCTSFFPFRMWLDGEVVRGALGGDGYVRPAFRRRGLGGLLHDASRQAMPAHRIACMYGAPGAMNVTPLKHGGSRELGHVARWVRPLRPSGRVPLANVVARALAPRTRLRLDPLDDLDARVDELWAETRSELRLAAVRDAAFYTWRFREAPAQRQPTYAIVDGARTLGVCALERVHDACRIVDLTAPRRHWHACLRAITAFCAETSDARIVDLKLFTRDARQRRLWAAGFLERDGKPFLCMIPTDGDRRFVDPERWFYTQADSDLDDHR